MCSMRKDGKTYKQIYVEIYSQDFSVVRRRIKMRTIFHNIFKCFLLRPRRDTQSRSVILFKWATAVDTAYVEAVPIIGAESKPVVFVTFNTDVSKFNAFTLIYL
jgi:hypothetical protein